MKKLKQPVAILCLLILLGTLAVPFSGVSAADPTPTPSTSVSPAASGSPVPPPPGGTKGAKLPDPEGCLSWGHGLNLGVCVEGVIYSVLEFSIRAMSRMLSAFASLLAGTIKYSESPGLLAPPVIQQVWETFRDIVNMFFILVLIIMAFGTIFDIEHYTFKDMFAKFLIAALLINFSFVIATYILHLANNISLVFLTSDTDIAARLHQGLLIGQSTSQSFGAFKGSEAANILPIIIHMATILVFMVISCGALFAATLWVIARIVVMWLLLIVSPLAWFGYTLPSLKEQTWDKWWSLFISWAFFLPVYLFFLMLAFLILSAKKNIGTDVNIDQVLNSAGSFGKFFLSIFGSQEILFFMLTIFFLIGGIWAAFQVGNFAANGAGALMKGLHGRMKAIPLPGTGWLSGTGRTMSAGDILAMGKGGLETFKEKGFPAEGKLSKLRFLYSGKYGEERGAEVAKNRFEEMFGYRGKGAAAPESEIKETKHAQDELAKKIDAGDLTPEEVVGHLNAGGIVDKLGNIDTHMAAYYRYAAEQGSLERGKFDELMDKLKDKNMGLATDIAKVYIKNVEKKEQLMGIVSADGIYADKRMGAIRREADDVLKSKDGKKAIQSLDIGDPEKAAKAMKLLTQAVIDLGGAGTKKSNEFLKEMAKFNPKVVMKYIEDKGDEALKKEMGYVEEDIKTPDDSAEGFSTQRLKAKQNFYRKNWAKTQQELAELSEETWDDSQFQLEYVRRLRGQTKRQLARHRESMGKAIFEFGGGTAGAKNFYLRKILDPAIAVAPGKPDDGTPDLPE